MDAQSRKPPSWAPALLKQFGTNIYGKPNWRVIWSEDRVRFECGEWRRTYGEGRNRWMVEKWCPPDFYGSREAWEAMREPDGSSSLGPFPSEGDYEWTFTFETPEGDGCELNAGLLALLCRCIERGKLLSDDQRKCAVVARRQREQEQWEERAGAIFDEAQGPFLGNAVSGIPSKRRADDIIIRPKPEVIQRFGQHGPQQL